MSEKNSKKKKKRKIQGKQNEGNNKDRLEINEANK